jgi:WASH complex subunit 7
MTKATALALCRLTELLKAVEHTFHRRSLLLAETFSHVVQLLGHKALSTVIAAKVSLINVDDYETL